MNSVPFGSIERIKLKERSFGIVRLRGNSLLSFPSIAVPLVDGSPCSNVSLWELLSYHVLVFNALL